MRKKSAIADYFKFCFSMSAHKYRLEPAYQRINLIDEEDEPIAGAEKGAK